MKWHKKLPLKQCGLKHVQSLLRGSIDGLVVVLCADMGTSEQRLSTTTVGELSALAGGRLNSLIFPSQPSEVEEKALLRWK